MGRSWARSVLVAGAAAFLVGVTLAGPAGAGEADGCTWSVRSLDRDGKVIDTASGPGQGATKDDPLLIDQQGSIAYQGTTDEVIAHGSWNVEVSGGPGISFGGDVTNDSGDTEKSGTEELESRLTVDVGPFGRVAFFSGLIRVDFEATGEGGATCTASGWLETDSNTFGSVPFIVGGLASLLGLGLLFFGWPVAQGGTAGAGGAGGAGSAAGAEAAGPSGPTPGTGGGGAPAQGAGPRPGPIGGAP
jgi:hypothetical protein